MIRYVILLDFLPLQVILQCTGNSDKPPRFIWERDGVAISPNTDHRYVPYFQYKVGFHLFFYCKTNVNFIA